MRERLTTLDWQREMLSEAGTGAEPLPTVQPGAFARPLGERHARRRVRHARVAAPMALDAKLEAGLIAICVAMMAQAPTFVRDELLEMAHQPGWTAFFLFGFPFLFHWLGSWALTVLAIWFLYDIVTYACYLWQQRGAPAVPLAIDAGPGATTHTQVIGTFLAVMAAELVLDSLLMAVGTMISGWF